MTFLWCLLAFIVFFYGYNGLIMKMYEAYRHKPWHEREGLDPEVRRKCEKEREMNMERQRQEAWQAELAKRRPAKQLTQLERFMKDRES